MYRCVRNEMWIFGSEFLAIGQKTGSRVCRSVSPPPMLPLRHHCEGGSYDAEPTVAGFMESRLNLPMCAATVFWVFIINTF